MQILLLKSGASSGQWVYERLKLRSLELYGLWHMCTFHLEVLHCIAQKLKYCAMAGRQNEHVFCSAAPC